MSASQTGVDSQTGTTGPGPGCGDGKLDDGEECDEGPENGGSDCTETCTVVSCGDEVVSAGEVCDDGDENGTNLGDCAPDCSKLVDAKVITLSFNYSQNGDMGGDMAVDTADSRCEAAGFTGYRALFSDGVNRRATVTPYVGDGQIDWVLSPWTRYLRGDGDLVWVTDASGLLGVENGMPASLLAPINGTTYIASSVTGMRQNWVAYTDNNCFGWASSGSGAHYRGDPYAVSGDFLDDENLVPNSCASSSLVYCVEQ